MSRIGNKPIPVLDGVKIAVQDRQVSVEGPKGKLQWEHRQEVAVKVDPGQPKDLPPLRLDEIENKYRFIRHLETTEKKDILNPGFDSKLDAT